MLGNRVSPRVLPCGLNADAAELGKTGGIIAVWAICEKLEGVRHWVSCRRYRVTFVATTRSASDRVARDGTEWTLSGRRERG